MTRREMILFTVIHDGAAVPADSAMRSAISAGQREFDPYIEAGAMVMLGRGFGAASVRGVITWLTLLGQYKYPNKVFDAEEEALFWVAKYVEAADGTPVRVKLLAERLIVAIDVIENPKLQRHSGNSRAVSAPC